jgi:hypothetical protein
MILTPTMPDNREQLFEIAHKYERFSSERPVVSANIFERPVHCVHNMLMYHTAFIIKDDISGFQCSALFT